MGSSPTLRCLSGSFRPRPPGLQDLMTASGKRPFGLRKRWFRFCLLYKTVLPVQPSRALLRGCRETVLQGAPPTVPRAPGTQWPRPQPPRDCCAWVLSPASPLLASHSCLAWGSKWEPRKRSGGCGQQRRQTGASAARVGRIPEATGRERQRLGPYRVPQALALRLDPSERWVSLSPA